MCAPNLCGLYRRGRRHNGQSWAARVSRGGRYHAVGNFASPELAAAARIAWLAAHPHAAPRPWNRGLWGALKRRLLALFHLLRPGVRLTRRQAWARLARWGHSFRAVKRALTALHAADLLDNAYDWRGYCAVGKAV